MIYLFSKGTPNDHVVYPTAGRGDSLTQPHRHGSHTRVRAGSTHIPNEMMADYYSQRGEK